MKLKTTLKLESREIEISVPENVTNWNIHSLIEDSTPQGVCAQAVHHFWFGLAHAETEIQAQSVVVAHLKMFYEQFSEDTNNLILTIHKFNLLDSACIRLFPQDKDLFNIIGLYIQGLILIAETLLKNATLEQFLGPATPLGIETFNTGRL